MPDAYQPIRELLKRVRARWRAVRLLEALIRSALAASAVLALALVAARFAPREPAVFGLVGALAAIGVAAAIIWAFAPLRQTPSDRQVARFIEERATTLDDRLASAVDVVVSDTASRSPSLVEPMLADAARRARDVDIDDLVHRGLLRRRAIQSGAAAMVLLLVGFLARGLVRETLDAVALTLFPSRVTLEIAPGDARIRAGASLAIRARLVGNQAPVVAQVRMGEGEGSRTTDMQAAGSGQFQLALESVTSSFTYRVTAGSVSSPDYTVTVARPPRVTRIDVDYAYPAALGLKGRTEEDGGDIYAPAGTDVRLRIHTDRRVASGRMALTEGGAVPLTARTETELAAGLKLVGDNSYRVVLTDRDGLVNPGETEYFIRALEDSPPQVRIVKPASDRRVTALEEVDIEAQADDDFGIARLDLVYAVGGRDEKVVPLGGGHGTSAEGRHTLFLEDFNLRPGDLISYYVRAFDVARGRRSHEARSDIFFLEVKGFEQEFALSQSQAASGGNDLDDLIAAQKEVVVATWKIERRAGVARGARPEQDIRAVGRAEAELKTRVEEISSAFRENTMRNPRQRPQQGGGGGDAARAGQTLSEEEAMAAASAAMGKAVTSLTSLKTRDALPPEMEALAYLLKAQGDVKRREVSRQQNGGGRYTNNRNYDLSALFDKELQRTQQTNYENRGTPGPRDDKSAGLLDRIRELARRQDELLKRQRDLARDRDTMTAEALKRELEKLTREQSELRQQAEELAGQPGARGSGGGRGMQDVSEQMRSAAGDLRRQDPGGASARGGRALEKLRELERQLQTSGPDERRRALGDMQLEARQLADAERRIANELGTAGQGKAGKDTARRLAGEQEGLASRARKLEEALKPMAGAPGDIGRDLARQQLVERMQKSAEDMRAASGPQGAELRRNAEAQRAAARALDKAAEALASANGGGDRESRKLSEQLAKAREIRDRLEDIGREAGRLGRQNARGSTPGGQKAPGEAGKPGEGRTGGGAGTDAAALRQEYVRQLQQTRQLLEELSRLDPSGPSGSGPTPEGGGMVLSAPGTEGFKQDFAQWEQLRIQATQALDKAESSISRKLQAKQSRDRLAAGVDDKAPSDYQRQVDSYFKAIAGGRK